MARLASATIMAALLASRAIAVPDFATEVRPILQKCLPCHGPDDRSRDGEPEAGLPGRCHR